MYKLTAHSLTRGEYFRPESMGLNLEERNSTATMVLPISGAVSLMPGDWVQDDCDPGSGIVWRVRTIDRQYDRDTQTVTLEHAIQVLKDQILFGEIKTSDMRATGSTAPSGTCYAKEAIQYILSSCADWTLDETSFAYGSVSNPYHFNGESLMEALETVSGSLEDCIWEYDFSAYPFKLKIKALSADVSSEMRMSRNITTLRYTIDRNGMFTRFYPIGKNNLRLSGGGYVSKNESTWGVVSKVETDQSKTTAAELTAWANERLSRHAEPLVTATIAGLELADATGESLDRFVIGKKCRLPLPEYGTTVTERVTKLSYRNKISEKEVVNITLANKLADVATILKEQAASSGRGGRYGAKNSEEDHAWIVDTTDKVELVAEAVAGQDSQGRVNWSRVSQLTVDGNGIDARVTIAEGNALSSATWITQNGESILSGVTAANGAASWIDQNGESILSGVTAANGAASWVNQNGSAVTAGVNALQDETTDLRGRLMIEAGKAGLIVEASDSRSVLVYKTVASLPATGDTTKLYFVTATGKYYEWKNGAYSEKDPGNAVKRASIIASINENGSSTVTISADKVDLGAYVLASTLDTNWIKTQIENAGLISVGTLQVANGTTPTGSANMVNILSLTRKYRVVEVLDGNNNVTGYKLQYTNLLNGATWVDCESADQSVNFSRATSLGGSWSGDIYTITASPQGNSKSIGFSGDPGTNHVRLTVVQDSGTPTSSSTNEKYIDVPVKVTQSNPNAASTDRFTTTLQNVNATAAWNKGFNAGAPTGATLGSKVTGTTWNVNIARGSYTAVGKTINLADAYTDARTGYYTQQQYNDNWAAGFNAGAPTGATLGSKVTGTTWNVSIARGSYSAVGKTINLADAYTDARSGYYTQAQYNAALATVPSGYFNSATVVFTPTANNGNGLNDGELVNPGTLKATAKNGNTELGYNTTELHIGNSSWSSGKMTVAIRLAASNGKVISRKEFSMPSSATWNWSSQTASTWLVSCTVNGKTYTSTHSKT